MSKCVWGGTLSSTEVDIKDDDLYTAGNDIYFNCEITGKSINKLNRQIIAIIKNYKYPTAETPSIFDGKKETKTMNIRIIIDSPGGDVYQVLKFIDYINIIKSQYPDFRYISCIVGTAFSAATLMAIVADKRQISKNASAMIHQMSLWDGGEINFINQRIKHYNELYNKLVEVYIKHSTKNKEMIIELLSKESWFESDKYLELGFVDEII